MEVPTTVFHTFLSKGYRGSFHFGAVMNKICVNAPRFGVNIGFLSHLGECLGEREF